MPKIALVIGINGQIGYYLKEYLINKNYVVHGIIRVSSTNQYSPIDHENQVTPVFCHHLINILSLSYRHCIIIIM